jgi:hypothetical protein
MKNPVIEKIIQKKEFSNLPEKDVELALEKFNKKEFLDIEKVKFTRDLLRKVFSGVASRKILNLKDKSSEWVLKKHLSTKERLKFYEEIYKKILKNLKGEFSVIDLGCGVNGFSYNYFKKLNLNINYTGVEAVGQLVNLMNNYFLKEKMNAKAFHLSLFELKKIKDLIKKAKKPRIIFLLKVVDSLEMLKKDYSKKLILEIAPFVKRMIISFATKSMKKRQRFKVNRKWFLEFLTENFKIINDFEIQGERYFIIENK